MSKSKKITQEAENVDDKLLVLKQSDPLVLAQNLIGAETNLELIGFFSPSSTTKGRPATTKTVVSTSKENGQRVKKMVSIIPLVDYGRPITSDLDMYRAFFKILKNLYYKYGKIENPVGFKDEHLIKAMGKKRHGRLTRDIRDWLYRMKGTVIKGSIFNKDKDKYVDTGIGVSVFDQVVTFGQMKDGEKSSQNYVWLSEWFLGNLNSGYIFLIDHEVYKSFKHPISKCLYGLLWWGFYAIRQTGGEFYWKDYSDLCKFLDITEYKYESKIREKLTPAHDELLKSKVISRWSIEKQAKGKNFNVKWWPGEVFESYYMTLKKGHGQLSLSGILEQTKAQLETEDEKTANELVKYFQLKINSRKNYKPKEKELQRAIELIDKYGQEKSLQIVKQAVKNIQASSFRPENFGAVINYTDQALSEIEEKTKAQKQQANQRKQNEEKKIEQYKQWIKQTPEQRVQHMVDFWVQGIKNLKHREPSAEEIETKQQEYINKLPSPEEKQKELFGRVIFKNDSLELIEK